MDNYLLDYETLGGFVDSLMKAKPVPAQTPEELNTLRENNIKRLDDKITQAVFGSLNDSQLKELNVLLDQDDGTPEVYEKFFQDAGINIQRTIAGVMQSYKEEFLGGQYA
jgi:hypothetical protein